MLAANENFYKLTAVDFRTNTVSVKLQATTSFDEWWITGLYGPQEDNEKLFFLNELTDQCHGLREVVGTWGF